MSDDTTMQGFLYTFKASDGSANLSLRFTTNGDGDGNYAIVSCVGSTITINGNSYEPTIPDGLYTLVSSGGVGGSCAGIDEAGLSFGPSNASLSWSGTGKLFAYEDPIRGSADVELIDTTFPTS